MEAMRRTLKKWHRAAAATIVSDCPILDDLAAH
jgi:hypothetical protein